MTQHAAEHGTDGLLADLTDAQAQAVRHERGPLLILAAAGSGKTRVITRRIAMLIHRGVPGWRICALTFTNKAAGEMRERIEHLLGANSRAVRGLTVTTFHSLCARLLRRYADIAGLPGVGPDFVIYDSSDQAALMKRVIGDLGLNTSNWPARAMLGQVSNAKNELLDAQAFEKNAGDFYSRNIAKIYTAYERALRRANAVDFDDLLLLTARMLRECEPARQEIQDRWRHLLIDEYQDTNRAQFAIASQLVGLDPGAEAPNVCVVGDPDQSIYGWRGADISNILEFEQRYPGATVIALGENFRSRAPILGAADALIKHNIQRKDKPLFTRREGGSDVSATVCRDERHEASLVSDWLRALHDGDAGLATGDEAVAPVAWKDMAVFYRTNALSRVLEDALRADGVPYVIARGTAFYEREEIKDALAYLRVLANPADDVSLRRIINKPTRGIGKATLDEIDALAGREQTPLIDAVRNAAASGESLGLTARATNALQKFLAMFDGWRETCEYMGEEVVGDLAELVERIVRESGLEKHYLQKATRSGEPGEEKAENLAELISSAAEFAEGYDPTGDPAMETPDLEELDEIPDFAADLAADAKADEFAGLPPLLGMLRAYLESVALVADADKVDPSQGAVTLMTLHAAKGLEFEAAAVVGLEEGLLPHGRSIESESALEEERRLLFVGMTRAMERLLLTSARYRTHRGVHERTIPSRFLEELPREHVTMSDQSESFEAGSWDEGSSSMGDWSGGNDPAQPDELDGLREGLMVRHPRFGVGKVDAIVSRGTNPRVRILFRDAGPKTIVLGYAPLEPLD
ncbi:MAG: ATP-dependent helicase [Phycisphaerales bacterium]